MKLLISSILLTLIISISCSSSQQSKSVEVKNDSLVYQLAKQNQILLTNNAEFIRHTPLHGASSFLVEYNSEIYAVTAKHLIGADGGVEPQINANELNDCIDSWKMFPRVPVHEVTDTVIIGSEKMNYKNRDKDILVLPIKNKSFNIYALKPEFNMPKQGDDLFFIGCPYSEINCKQNVYQATFDSFDEVSSLLICKSKSTIEIAGFSGAPLLDSKGYVIGTIRGGGEQDGDYYIVATFIKEIKEIVNK